MEKNITFIPMPGPVGPTGSTATTAINFSGPLLGDVTGVQTGTVVSFVGGQTAANVAAATILANNATENNIPDTIVKRDASGNFSAGTITSNLVGSASLNVLKSGDTMTGQLTLPAGSSTTPSLQFTNNINTGLSATGNTLSFNANGIQGMTISQTGTTILNSLTTNGSFIVNNTGRFTNTLTVSSGGAIITGNSSIAGNFTLAGNQTLNGQLSLQAHSGGGAWTITTSSQFVQGFVNASGACIVTNFASYQYYRLNNWCYAQISSFVNTPQAVTASGPIILAGVFGANYRTTTDQYVGNIMLTDNGIVKMARILVRASTGNVEISNLDGSDFTTTVTLGIGGLQNSIFISFATPV